MLEQCFCCEVWVLEQQRRMGFLMCFNNLISNFFSLSFLFLFFNFVYALQHINPKGHVTLLLLLMFWHIICIFYYKAPWCYMFMHWLPIDFLFWCSNNIQFDLLVIIIFILCCCLYVSVWNLVKITWYKQLSLQLVVSVTFPNVCSVFTRPWTKKAPPDGLSFFSFRPVMEWKD